MPLFGVSSPENTFISHVMVFETGSMQQESLGHCLVMTAMLAYLSDKAIVTIQTVGFNKKLGVASWG